MLDNNHFRYYLFKKKINNLLIPIPGLVYRSVDFQDDVISADEAMRIDRLVAFIQYYLIGFADTQTKTQYVYNGEGNILIGELNTKSTPVSSTAST